MNYNYFIFKYKISWVCIYIYTFRFFSVEFMSNNWLLESIRYRINSSSFSNESVNFLDEKKKFLIRIIINYFMWLITLFHLNLWKLDFQPSWWTHRALRLRPNFLIHCCHFYLINHLFLLNKIRILNQKSIKWKIIKNMYL